MKNNNVTIVYDGECPFCSDFVALNRLKESGYTLTIINARDTKNPVVVDLRKSYDIDNGMIVIYREKVLYGSSAARFISSSYSHKVLRASLYRLILGNQKIANILYPVLVFLRKLYFRLVGKKFINEDN
jgi:predicted DCC family thiol-disulfide oxidoreductase YuxK